MKFQFLFGFDEIVKTGYAGAGRITHYQARCNLYYLYSVPFHFLDIGLNIATRAPIADVVSNKFDFGILLPTERTFSFPQRSEALAAGTRAIAVTVNYVNPSLALHGVNFPNSDFTLLTNRLIVVHES